MIKDGNHVELQSVGAGAVNQVVKAIAISRGFLSPVGIDIVCVPAFADIVIDGEYRTAIRFTVETREPVHPATLPDDGAEGGPSDAAESDGSASTQTASSDQ